MRTVVQTWQPVIQQEIVHLIDEFIHEHARFALDQEQLKYLQKISTSGKQFRGCLLAGFYELLKPEISEAEKKVVARLAAAIELHGTAILLHDDIIDRSETRRGVASVHTHMAEVAQARSLSDAQHFGVGAAICLADVLFFLADKTVAELDLLAELRIKIAAINGEELALLGLAEIEDMRLSSSAETFTKEDILKMFAGKTGRYTGRWPLHIACVLVGADASITAQILKVGENIGVLYQLKDDELGIFGDEKETGKSTTSDLLEGKKTLYYWHLQQLPEKEKQKVFSIIGNTAASNEEIEWVKNLIIEKGIKDQVAKEIESLKKDVVKEIGQLDIAQSANIFLLEVLEFVVTRNK